VSDTVCYGRVLDCCVNSAKTKLPSRFIINLLASFRRYSPDITKDKASYFKFLFRIFFYIPTQQLEKNRRQYFDFIEVVKFSALG